MTKEERKLNAIEKLSELNEEDNFSFLNERLDQVLLTGIEAVKKDKFSLKSFPIFEQYMKCDVIFSQFDMAMVQVAFFASVVVFPQ